MVTLSAGAPLLLGCSIVSVASEPALPMSPNSLDAGSPATAATPDATSITSDMMVSHFMVTVLEAGTGTLALTWLVTAATSK